MDEVRKVKDGEDEPAIRKAVEALSQAVQKIGAAAYQQQPEPEAAAEPGNREGRTGSRPDDPGNQSDRTGRGEIGV